jgi:hypothetical protein
MGGGGVIGYGEEQPSTQYDYWRRINLVNAPENRKGFENSWKIFNSMQIPILIRFQETFFNMFKILILEKTYDLLCL